ncbi:hypothetical protein D3C78_1494320 [compost metagenome]
MEGVEHQQGLFQRIGGDGADFRIVQQVDQRANVVAAEHRAQQFRRLGTADHRTSFLAQRHGGQVGRLHLGGIVHAGRHAVGQQLDQVLLFASGRILQQFDQFSGLFSRKGQRGNPQSRAFGNVLAVVIQHVRPAQKSGWKKGCRAEL